LISLDLMTLADADVFSTETFVVKGNVSSPSRVYKASFV
jgi:hypothetical protein